MEFARLIDHLRNFTPLGGDAEARLALASTLETLAVELPEHLVRALKAALPVECSPPLLAGLAASRQAEQGSTPHASTSLRGQALERTQEPRDPPGSRPQPEVLRRGVLDLVGLVEDEVGVVGKELGPRPPEGEIGEEERVVGDDDVGVLEPALAGLVVAGVVEVAAAPSARP